MGLADYGKVLTEGGVVDGTKETDIVVNAPVRKVAIGCPNSC